MPYSVTDSAQQKTQSQTMSPEKPGACDSAFFQREAFWKEALASASILAWIVSKAMNHTGIA